MTEGSFVRGPSSIGAPQVPVAAGRDDFRGGRDVRDKRDIRGGGRDIGDDEVTVRNVGNVGYVCNAGNAVESGGNVGYNQHPGQWLDTGDDGGTYHLNGDLDTSRCAREFDLVRVLL